MSVSALSILIGYFLLYAAAVAAFVIWRRVSRQDRKPFADELKLLRGPGETQRRLVAALDENLDQYLVAAGAVPLLIAGVLVWIASHLSGSAATIGIIVTLSVFLGALIFSARWLVAKIVERQNRYLGYFGERVVAEALEPLKISGARVFHDVPCGDAELTFNIDHVVVGPGGVFAIETKTRRKGHSREGFAAHEIIYDGQVLAYPWGEDRHGLAQAVRQSRWLEDWLAQLLGRRTPVQPILTFPGWMIIRRGAGAVVVLNQKEIPAAIASRGRGTLSEQEIDLIAGQLDARCRDVAF